LRERAVGGGRKYALDVPTRLLMTLLWLKVYPTREVLGYLFGIDERTARRDVRDVLEVLQDLAVFPLERRRARKQGHSLAEVIENFPAVEVLIDSQEQRIRRPTPMEEAEALRLGQEEGAHAASARRLSRRAAEYRRSAAVCRAARVIRHC
jgi:hypothetical protein